LRPQIQNRREEAEELTMQEVASAEWKTEESAMSNNDNREDIEIGQERLATEDGIAPDTPHHKASEKFIPKASKAELQTDQALDENRDNLATIIDRLSHRLELQITKGHSDSKETLSLQEDMDRVARQLLNSSKGTNPSQQKTHFIGETIVDDSSHLVALTTTADLFYVGKATATNHSESIIGSMTPEDFQLLMRRRYVRKSVAGQGKTEEAQRSRARGRHNGVDKPNRSCRGRRCSTTSEDSSGTDVVTSDGEESN
jgi:hypothetical protein